MLGAGEDRRGGSKYPLRTTIETKAGERKAKEGYKEKLRERRSQEAQEIRRASTGSLSVSRRAARREEVWDDPWGFGRPIE